jgi:hypothetical protein
MAEQFQREAVLINEVDKSPIPLMLLVGAHGLGGARENRSDVSPDLIAQAGMAGEGRRSLPQRNEMRIVRLRPLQLRQFRPGVADLVQGFDCSLGQPLVRRISG